MPLAFPLSTSLRALTKQVLQDAAIPGTQIIASRRQPLKSGSDAALLIYTPEEDMRGLPGSAPQAFEGTVTVAVEIQVKGDDDEAIEDSADDLAQQVLDTLIENQTWLQEIERVERIRKRVELVEDGESRFGVAQLAIDVFAQFEAGVTATDNFVSLEGRKPDHGVDLAPPDGEIEVEIDIRPPQV